MTVTWFNIRSFLFSRLFLFFACYCSVLSSPISHPLVSDSHLDNVIPDYFDSKRSEKAFHRIKPDAGDGIDVREIVSRPFVGKSKRKVDKLSGSQQIADFRLKWSTTLASPIFSTPVVFPSGVNGKKQIFVNTYYRFAELLNSDGFKSWGWPLSFEDSSFQSSPLLYDVDGDGNVDMGLVDKNANMFWVRIGEFGEFLEDYHIQIPKLKVKRDWAVGLDPNFVDSYVMLSMFDHGDRDVAPGTSAARRAHPDDLKSMELVRPPSVYPGIGVQHGTTSQEGAVFPPKSSFNEHRRLQAVAEDVEIKTNMASNNKSSGQQAIEFPQTNLSQIVSPQSNSLSDQSHALQERTDEAVTQIDHTVPSEIYYDNYGSMLNRSDGNMVDDYVALSQEYYYHLPGEHGDDYDDAAVPRSTDPVRAAEIEKLVAEKRHEFDLREESQSVLKGGGDDDDLLIEQRIRDVVDPGSIRHHHHHNETGEAKTADDFDSYYYSTVRAGKVPPTDDGMAYYMSRSYGGYINESEYLSVDAHVLASPALVDVNGDGHMEILYSVSYYFDKADYAGKSLDFDPDMYVAGGIACWDVQEQYWAWMVHLDLTTAKSEFQAMIYASPTVADLDGDGRHEVIIGTALGLLYVLDGESGFVRRFFPIQFHSIQAQVPVGDLTGGRDLEMIVADMGGTVAVVNMHGDILWDVQVSGSVPFTPTLGDVDGDGQIDIVVVAESKKRGRGSLIYALRGDTGQVLVGYPIALPNRASVSSPVLLADLHDKSASRFTPASNKSTSNDRTAENRSRFRQPLILEADQPFSLYASQSSSDERGVETGNAQANTLHLIVTSFDGSVYIIDGIDSNVGMKKDSSEPTKGVEKFDALVNGRNIGKDKRVVETHAQRIDVGEHIYSIPLLDDVTGDGFLDLVVGTLNGQLMLFESSIAYHVVNAWSAFPKDRANGFTCCDAGISIPYEEKMRLKQLDIKGRNNLSVSFDIVDSRYSKSAAAGEIVTYRVSITKGSRRIDELWSGEFTAPGRYQAFISVTPPQQSLLLVSMTSEHGIYYEDSVHISISTRFYIWMKYMVLGPLALLSVTLLTRFRRFM